MGREFAMGGAGAAFTSMALRQVAVHQASAAGELADEVIVCGGRAAPCVPHGRRYMGGGSERKVWFGANVGRVRLLDAALCLRTLVHYLQRL
jgi:hypothetical protein